MGVDWTAGLLGGVAGLGKGMAEMAADKRKELAKRLRMEAQAKIDKEMQQAGFTHAEGLTDKKIASSEKIAGDRNQLMRDLAAQEDALKREMLQAKQDGAKAAEMRATIAAFAEARNILANGGTTEEANAPLIAIGLPGFSERVVDEGSEGFLGFGKRPPKIERVWDGSGKPSSLQDELDMLAAEGMKPSYKGRGASGGWGGGASGGW